MSGLLDRQAEYMREQLQAHPDLIKRLEEHLQEAWAIARASEHLMELYRTGQIVTTPEQANIMHILLGQIDTAVMTPVKTIPIALGEAAFKSAYTEVHGVGQRLVFGEGAIRNAD